MPACDSFKIYQAFIEKRKGGVCQNKSGLEKYLFVFYGQSIIFLDIFEEKKTPKLPNSLKIQNFYYIWHGGHKTL